MNEQCSSSDVDTIDLLNKAMFTRGRRRVVNNTIYMSIKCSVIISAGQEVIYGCG